MLKIKNQINQSINRIKGKSREEQGRSITLKFTRRTAAGLVPDRMAAAPEGLTRADFPVNTKVVRGPAWCGDQMYGDQDGGAGKVGTVVQAGGRCIYPSMRAILGDQTDDETGFTVDVACVEGNTRGGQFAGFKVTAASYRWEGVTKRRVQC